MKISELFEGKFVEPFTKSGKPNPNHPSYEKNKAAYDALKPAKAPKETSAEKAKKLENALYTCSTALMVDGWGELDSSDLLTHKIIPAIKKRIKADPGKYSEDFKEALAQTEGRWGIYDDFIKFLDKTVQKFEKCKNFNAYVDRTEKEYKELMADQVQESVTSDISISNNDFEKIEVADVADQDLARYVKVAQAKRDSHERRAAKSNTRPKVGTTPTNSEIEGAKSYDARIKALDKKIVAAKKKM